MSSLETISVGAATKNRILWPTLGFVDTWEVTVKRLVATSYDYFVETSDAQAPEIAEDVSWFFTEEWQIGERKADEDLACGRFKDFKTIDELLAFLHAKKHEKQAKEKA